MKQMAGFLGLTLVCSMVFAQEDTNSVMEIDWQAGPVMGNMSTISTLEVPEGYIFTGPEGTEKVMESMGNLVNGSEIGMVYSLSNSWFAVFEFDPIGYVKDDEKDSLDAKAILKSLREGQVQANERRRAMQLSELEIDGWYKQPFYNEKTHNLEWCTQLRLKGSDEPFANHNIRILGRHGVTQITLVADLDQLDTAIPELADILNGYTYSAGGSYAEYRQGDKIAKYGLTALVAGGAAAVAVKSGLFKYIWKGLVIGAAAVGGFFKKMFGKKAEQ